MKHLYFKLIIIGGSFFVLYVSLSLLSLRGLMYGQVAHNALGVAEKVVDDIDYDSVRWDIGKLISDADIPTDRPLYVFTRDGFVIVRNRAIRGFLDQANYDFSSSFVSPRTITTSVNDRWRLYSVPIVKDKITVGTITIGYVQPEWSTLDQIDAQLVQAAAELSSQVSVENGIVVDKVDQRLISGKLSFEIIDKHNHALISSGGLPSYTDRSYVAEYLRKESLTVYDEHSGEKFYVRIVPIAKHGETVGMVAVGESLKLTESFFRHQLQLSLLVGQITLVLMSVSFVYVTKNDLNKWLQALGQTVKPLLPPKRHLFFDRGESVVHINQQSIPIPYASYQYDLCKVLLAKPTKRFECDELATALGEESVTGQWRKVYDAVRAINEKSCKAVGVPLILAEAKTFRVNPSLTTVTHIDSTVANVR